MIYLGYTILSILSIATVYSVLPKRKPKNTIPTNVVKELNKKYKKNKTCTIGIFVDTIDKSGVIFGVIEVNESNIETVRKAILNNIFEDILPYHENLDYSSIKKNYYYIATNNGLHIDLAREL